jgi:hypothetical protein
MALSLKERRPQASQYPTYDQTDQADQTTAYPATQESWWTDRKYKGQGKENRFGRGRVEGPRRNNNGNRPPKKCYVCGKEGCWSTKHTPDERAKAYQRFKSNSNGHDKSTTAYATFLAWAEGNEGADDDNDAEYPLVMQYWQDEDPLDPQYCEEDNDPAYNSIFCDIEPVNNAKIATIHADASTYHYVTGDDRYHAAPPQLTATAFVFEGRYSAATFQGIMPDTGAAKWSTASEPQFRALARQSPGVELNISTVGMAQIKFGQRGSISSIGTTTMPTPLGSMEF